MSASTPPGNGQLIMLNGGPLDGQLRRFPRYPGLYGEVDKDGAPISVYAEVESISESRDVLPFMYQGPLFWSSPPESAQR
jgi:hypothetical protein